MMVIGLLLWLQCCCHLVSPSQSYYIRYIDWPLHSSDLPSYSNKVSLAYTDNSTAEGFKWYVDDCIIADSRISDSSNFTMICYISGFHEVMFSNGSLTHTILIPIESSPYCHLWQTVVMSSIGNSSHLLSLQVSITSALIRDFTHERLNDQYYKAGEHPNIKLLSHTNEFTVVDHGYSKECGCWQFDIQGGEGDITSLPYEVLYKVESRGVSLFSCSVRPMMFVGSRPRYYELQLSSDVVPTISQLQSGSLHLYQDPRLLSMMVITNGSWIIITQDGLVTQSCIQIEDGNNNIGQVMGVAFTSWSICLLMGGDGLTSSISVLSNSSVTINSTTGIPAVSDMDRLTGRAKRGNYDNLDIVVGWTTTGNTVYLSVNGGTDFSIMTFGNQSFIGIDCLRVHPLLDQLMLLVSVNNTHSEFHKYDISTGVLTRMDMSLFQSCSGNMCQPLNFEYFPGYFGDILVWSETSLYHCTDKSTITQEITIMHQEDNSRRIAEYIFEEGESIQSVALGSSGQFSFITSNYSLFYGRVSTGSALKILQSINEVYPFFDASGNLKLASIADLTGQQQIEFETIPYRSIILSLLYPPTGCPVYDWSTNVLLDEAYFLDKNEQLQFWVSLTPKPWTTNDISLTLTNEEVVSWEEVVTEQQTAVQGAIKRTKSVLVRPHPDSAANQSFTVLKFTPSIEDMSCGQSKQTEANIYLTCPLNRHIRLRGSNTSCPNYHNFTYSISKAHYDPDYSGRVSVSAFNDKTVEYNVAEWGCPIEVHYNDEYLPVLELYDGDTFKEQVNVDFVVREIHGRTDFGYSGTSRDAKCIRTPQQWIHLLANTNESFNAWNSQNYESCFDNVTRVDYAPVDTMVPYEILNSTGVSKIKWSSHDGGVYVFTATVVDANYSFCNLTVTFGVVVSSAIEKTYLNYIVLSLTCVVGVVGLLLSFASYRQLVLKDNKTL